MESSFFPQNKLKNGPFQPHSHPLKNASAFQSKRKYVSNKTQVRFNPNVKAFSVKRTCVFSKPSEFLRKSFFIQKIYDSKGFYYLRPVQTNLANPCLPSNIT